MEFLGELGLLSSQAFRAEHRSPGGRGVAAAYEFLINLVVAGLAVSRREMSGNHKTVVIELVFSLALLRLVAIEAVHTNGGVLAHFVFVNDGILLSRMAFCAFPAGLDEGYIGLIDFRPRPGAVHEKSPYDQRKCNDQGNEDITEWHQPSSQQET